MNIGAKNALGRTNARIERLLRLSPLILLLLMCLVISLINPNVLTPRNLVQICIQSAAVIVLALSVMVWMISGGMDMSAAYGTSFYIIVMGNALVRSESLLVGLAAMFGSAILIGLFNGIFIGIFEIPSFIVTLASMSIIQGLMLIVSASHAAVLKHPVLKFIGMGNILGVPMILVFTLAVAVVVWWVMKYTRFGTNVYALGSNMNAARVSGVNIARQQIKIYLFSAIFTAMAAIVLAARVSIVSPGIGGTKFLLNAVTATIIGGTSSLGGRGNVPGTVVGGLLIGLINFSMTSLGVKSTSVDMVTGLIVIIALCVDVLLGRVRQKLEQRA